MMHSGTREILLALRAEAATRLERLGRSREDIVEAAQGANIDDEHDPEGATIAFEREQLRAMITQANSRLAEVDLALDRLAAGSYGICETCGEPISQGRLEARPMASRCVRHA